MKNFKLNVNLITAIIFILFINNSVFGQRNYVKFSMYLVPQNHKDGMKCKGTTMYYYIPEWIYVNEPMNKAFEYTLNPQHISIPQRTRKGIGTKKCVDSKRTTLSLLTFYVNKMQTGIGIVSSNFVLHMGKARGDVGDHSWSEVSHTGNDNITDMRNSLRNHKVTVVGSYLCYLYFYGFSDKNEGDNVGEIGHLTKTIKVVEPKLTYGTTTYLSTDSPVSVFEFLEENNHDGILINHKEYIKDELASNSSYFSVSSKSGAITGSGKNAMFDPSKVSFKKGEITKNITVDFNIFGKTYSKAITVKAVPDIYKLVPYSDYEVRSSKHNGSNLKALLLKQFELGAETYLNMINVPDKFPDWKENDYWDYNTTKTYSYNLSLKDFTGEKSIRVKMIENRFNLKEKVRVQEGVSWNDDNTRFKLRVCLGGKSYRLADLFDSEFQDGRFKFISSSNNLTASAINGDNTNNAMVNTDKAGSMEIRFYINEEVIDFDVEIISKPNLNILLEDFYCDEEKFLLKDKVKISPDYSKIYKLTVNNEEEDFDTYEFDTRFFDKKNYVFKFFAKTGYIYVNAKEVKFLEKTMLVCSASPTLFLQNYLVNSSNNGKFFKNNMPFSGIFNPNEEEVGTYEISYIENNGNCDKRTKMTITLEETPSINTFVKDSYTLYLGSLETYNKQSFIDYVQKELLGNSNISILMSNDFPSNLTSFIEYDEEIELSLTAIMNKELSPNCLHQNQEKIFTVILKENRFDLEKELATLRLKQRGDKLVLCKSDKGDYKLNNLFKEGYRNGKFSYIYTDDDNDPNNDEDAIILNDDILLLNRAINANITYSLTKNGYTNTFNFIVEIIGVDYSDVKIADIPNVCFSKPIDLKPYVFPPKGTFEASYTFNNSGAIGEDGVLIPGLAGKGIHEVTYTVGKLGCTKSKRFKVVINDLMPTHYGWLDKIPNVCSNSEPINLRNFVNTDKGYFVGTGVAGDFFDPLITGPGLHKINFVFESEENTDCKLVLPATIHILKAPSIKYSNIPIQCYRDSLIDISKYFMPQGGVFSGIGIMDNKGLFEASQSGLGTHKISYIYTDTNQCSTTYDFEISVDALIDKNRVIEDLPILCKDSKPIFLPDYVKKHKPNTATQTSVFTGKGVAENYFDPSKVSVGVSDIIYNVNEGRCKHESVKEIKTDRAVGFNFKEFPVLCTKEPLNLDDYVNIKGGRFFGRGVENNIFYPERVGEGIYIIDYQYEFPNSCMVSDFKYLKVSSLEPINFKAENDKVTVTDGEWIKFVPDNENKASDKNLDYYWEFSDGDYSFQKDVYKYFYLNWQYVGWNDEYKMNEYKIVGDNKFDVTLNVTSEGCTKSITKYKYVTVLPNDNQFLARVPQAKSDKEKLMQGKIIATDVVLSDFKDNSIAKARNLKEIDIVKIWHNNKMLHIKNANLFTDIRVFNASGQEVKVIENLKDSEYINEHHYPLNLDNGIYIIKFNHKTHKLYINEK